MRFVALPNAILIQQQNLHLFKEAKGIKGKKPSKMADYIRLAG